MDSDTGGQDSQRRAAAEIARRKVLAAYDKVANSDVKSTYTTPSGTHMKDEPLKNSRIDSESWRRYHSEWQRYYQRYYGDYYSNMARQYIAKERLKDAKKQADEEDIIYALAQASKDEKPESGLKLGEEKSTAKLQYSKEKPTAELKLREKIRQKATDGAQKSRRFRKFIPLIAGMSVVLLVLFLQYNRIIFAPLAAYVSPGNAPASHIEALDPTITQTVSADPRLIIPKLNIDVPIRFGVSLSEVMSAMNNGVAHYRIAGASAYPGEIGNFVITGHSAGDVYSSNPYKYIFSGLERLEEGDLIYANYQSTRYTYQVVSKTVVEPSNVDALIVETDKPLITLVTCTPLGTSRYRLLVTGEQISPDYEGSKEQETIATDENDSVLPANEPSFLEKVWKFLTGQ